MKIPPQYKITDKILSLISQIDSYKLFFQSFDIPLIQKEKIERVSLLKSSLFSAKIEGNSLTMEEMDYTNDEKQKKEILNIIKATKYIQQNINKGTEINQEIIQELHAIVMVGLSPDAGHLRGEMGAIFNQAGVAVYISPPPEKIKSLITELTQYVNQQEEFPLITVFLSHLVFEKIHPFIDGNGRVGRLLVYALLKSKGYDFKLFVPLEEYLENNKTDYYYFLDIGLKQTNEYLEFILTAFLKELEKMKQTVELEINKKDIILLPPRQEEMFNIIKDHQVVSFDFLCRRFLKVPKRTLRYDLKKLTDKKMVIKIGKTKGSYYRIIQ